MQNESQRRREVRMGTAELVGSMGLTFFCNRCVEVFHKFDRDEEVSGELEETCKKALAAFKSLKWPAERPSVKAEKVALFNTNEEIRSFERVLSRSKPASEALDVLIRDLEGMVSDKPVAEKRETAKRLRGFFDILGDYSFYATRTSLRAH